MYIGGAASNPHSACAVDRGILAQLRQQGLRDGPAHEFSFNCYKFKPQKRTRARARETRQRILTRRAVGREIVSLSALPPVRVYENKDVAHALTVILGTVSDASSADCRGSTGLESDVPSEVSETSLGPS